MKITFLTVMPTPYVQDLFQALQLDSRLDLKVWYLEQEAPNTRWGCQRMPAYAEVLLGRWIGRENTRVHWNPGICKRLRRSDADIFVVAGYIGLTNQIVMRWLNRSGRRWVFWGEVPGLNQRSRIGNMIRRKLQQPLAGAVGIAGVGSHAVDAYQQLVSSREMREKGEETIGSENLNRLPIGECASMCRKPSPRFARPSQGEGDVDGASRLVTCDSRVFANLPYVCDLSAFQAAANNRPKTKHTRFLYCGQLVKRKGVDLLLSAFLTVARQSSECTLTFVGDGPLRSELEQQIPATLSNRVVFAGFQSVDALPAFFANADMFVLPSRHDGWGVVVNQAIGAGLPVIATSAVGAVNDLVRHDINGEVVAPDDPNALRNAIKRAIDNPGRLDAMKAASTQVQKTIELGAAVEQWVRFLELSKESVVASGKQAEDCQRSRSGKGKRVC